MQTINVLFHGVGTPARDLEDGEAPYWVARSVLDGVLDEVAADPRVRLSVDDGNASDAGIVLPALVERGLRATFFVLAGRLDQPGSLSRNQVLELRDAGMGVGNHGMHHRPWRGLPPRLLTEELVAAREVLEDLLGEPVTQAAAPLGRYDRRVLHRLRALGYTQVHTSDRRPARADAWLQPRYSVLGADDAGSVRRNILTTPPLHERARLHAIGLVKRLR